MVLFGCSPVEVPMLQASTATADTPDNHSVVDISVESATSDINAEEPSHHSLQDFEELLLEAGYGNLNKEECIHRLRSSSSTSFSDGSFLTASQDRESSSETDDDCAHCPDLEAQQQEQQTLKAPMAPELEENVVEEGQISGPAILDDSSIIANDGKKEERPLPTDKDEIPVISLEGIELLAEKKKPVTEEETAEEGEEEVRGATALETRSIASTLEDDHDSVTSVQSLVSVVAELITFPIRAMAAVIAGLEQEIAPYRPERAEFMSVGILKSPIDMDSLGMTLENQVVQETQKRILVIKDIEPTGPWSMSPLRVGDRIISINHTPVNDWQPSEVDSYWATLIDRVTLVAHNPSGDPQKVAVMITKSDPSTRTGLGMRSSRPGRIKVSRVNGLFEDSLLSPGDLILSINNEGVNGHSSSDTANTILQSPKFVTIVARANAHNAFVIASNQGTDSSACEGLVATTRSSVEDGTANPPSMDGDIEMQPRRELDQNDRCDNCGSSSWITLEVLHWTGNLYVLSIFALGLFACFCYRLGIGCIVGVMVITTVMANLINCNIRHVQRQNKENIPARRCTTFQLSSNMIVIGAFTFLVVIWQLSEDLVIERQLVGAVALLLLVPMLLLVNLPSFCKQPTPILPDEFDDYIQEVDLEPEAVASLASGRA